VTAAAVRRWWRRRLDPGERFGLRLSLLAAAVLLAAVPFGWLVTQLEAGTDVARIDASAADSLHEWARRSPGAVRALKALTVLGATLWLLLAVVVPAGAWLWRQGRRRSAVFLGSTALVGGLLNYSVKLVVGRARPEFLEPVATAGGRSFPSGHAMSSTVVYGAVLIALLPVLAGRRRRVAAALATGALVTAVGFSRLGLGVHYLSDVLGGHLLGVAWLAASAAAFATWRSEAAAGQR
jgi:membrane-associated phospholipid phosphatase